jgi:hypothetical protein
MTAFLVYVLPCLNFSPLTVMQAEIPGQEQDGYDAGPTFFHGMQQVRVTYLPSFLSHIVYHSILKIPGHDLNSSLGA